MAWDDLGMYNWKCFKIEGRASVSIKEHLNIKPLNRDEQSASSSWRLRLTQNAVLPRLLEVEAVAPAKANDHGGSCVQIRRSL